METLTIVLIVVCVVLLAAGIFLAVRYFKGLTDEQRTMFINACTKAVKTILAALADGKITAAELLQIAQALIAVIASFAGKSSEVVAEELGATEYINTVSENEEIIIEGKTMANIEHKPINESTAEERAEELDRNLEAIKADEVYSSGAYDKMVVLYRNRFDSSKGKWDGDLAKQVAIEVLGYDKYRSLSSFEQGALVTNITHGKIDSA